MCQSGADCCQTGVHLRPSKPILGKNERTQEKKTSKRCLAHLFAAIDTEGVLAAINYEVGIGSIAVGENEKDCM